MYKIAICDDQQATLDYISAIVAGEFGEECKAYPFNTPKALESYAATVLKDSLDILIIDIDLVTDSGIRVTERLKKANPRIRVIYISGQIRNIVDVFETRPVYFLEKPIERSKLQSAILLAIRDIEDHAPNTISVESRSSTIQIDLREIMYFESSQHTVMVYEGENSREIRTKLDAIEKLLPERFCRCHQSYLVNFDYVREMQSEPIHPVQW